VIGRRSSSSRGRRAAAGAALSAILTAAVALLALSGCGESAEAKAHKQVCAARADVGVQIRALSGLSLNAAAASTARSSFEAIGKDVNEIKAATPKLKSATRRQVETATHEFVTKVGAIATSLGSSATPSQAAAQFREALTQLAAAYNGTLASISC
jgi:hypothetical protein